MRWPRLSSAGVLRTLTGSLALAATAYAAFYTRLAQPTLADLLLAAAAMVLTVGLVWATVTGHPGVARVASGAALLYVSAHIVSLIATSPIGAELTAVTIATNACELIVAALAWLIAASHAPPLEATGAT